MEKKSEVLLEGLINVNDQDWSRKAVIGSPNTGVYGSGCLEGVFATTNGMKGSYGLKADYGGGESKGAIYSNGDVHLMHGKVGIGTQDPKENLDVDGAIKVGERADTGAEEGTMRWNASIKKMQVFDGSSWVSLH